MLKIHKFNKRVKTSKKEDYQKANQSSSTNSSMNSSSLSRITKTEEDLLFKTDRKMPDEKDIYDIENKIDTNNCNTLGVNDFEGENYMSNRDVTIHKKIVPTTDSVVNIQKEITNRKKERENEQTKEKEKADDKNTQSSSNQSILSRELIVFFLIMIILLSLVAIIIFYVIKSSS